MRSGESPSNAQHPDLLPSPIWTEIEFGLTYGPKSTCDVNPYARASNWAQNTPMVNRTVNSTPSLYLISTKSSSQNGSLSPQKLDTTSLHTDREKCLLIRSLGLKLGRLN